MTNAKTLTARLGGDWHGNYGLAPGPDHSEKDRSLKIWDGPDGPLFHSFTGEPWPDIRDTLRAQGFLTDQFPRQPDRPPPTPRPENHKTAPDGRSEHAESLWNSGQAIKGTVAETYLQGRGLQSPWPETLRFLPELNHGPSAKAHPALLAKVTTLDLPDEPFQALHRTFLAEDGGDKASVQNNKMMLGPCKGGGVLFGTLAPFHDHVIVAEGIETALTLFQATGTATIACLSSLGLKAIRLPDFVKKITIAADNDPAGQNAATGLGDRLISEGRDVKVVHPSAEGQDFNDLLMETSNE